MFMCSSKKNQEMHFRLFQQACAKVGLAEQDSLNACVANSSGEILWVSQAWIDFGNKNGCGSKFIGQNYFKVLSKSAENQNEVAAFIQRGLFWLFENLKDEYFAVEYPCHTQESQSWYEATFVKISEGCRSYLVVLHSPVAPTRFPEIMAEAHLDNLELLNSKNSDFHKHFAGQIFSKLTLNDSDLSSCDFVCVEFRECRFVNCNFENAHFLSCAFLNCSFENCKWDGVEVKSCTFESVKFGCDNVYREIHFENCRSFLTSGFEKCDKTFFNHGMVAVFA